MDPVKALQNRFPSLDSSVVAMVYQECEENYELTLQRLEEMLDHGGALLAGPRNLHGNNKYWSQDPRRKTQGEEWVGPGYAAKSHSGSGARGMGSGKRWSQNEPNYQNGVWENVDGLKEEEGWKPYGGGGGGGPGKVGMGMRLHQDGPGDGSRMGPSHGSEYASMQEGMNYYDFNHRMGNSAGPRPMGPAVGPPGLGPGMRVGPGRGYDHSSGIRMGSIHRPGQFYDSHQYQSPMVGGARGPHPHYLQGQYPLMMPPPYPRQLPPPPPPPGSFSQSAIVNHRDDEDDKMGVSGRGYFGRQQPYGQSRMDDFHTVSRDRRRQAEERSKEYGRDSNSFVPKYPPPAHFHSAGEPSFEGKREKKKMILLRGLPGSGKTTLAKSLVGPHGVICSTDDFFVVNGRYSFDASKLPENHQKNKEKVRAVMQMGKSPVIIDNTNSTAWEMKPYIVMAVKDFGYSVEMQEPTTPWRFKTAELARRNIHGVTRQSIDRILEKFDHRVSVESILGGSAPQQMRSSSAPSTSDNNAGRASVQESVQAGTDESSDRNFKSAGFLKPKEEIDSGVSLSSSSGEDGRKPRRSVSPDTRGSRFADQQGASNIVHGARGRGRGRGEVTLASGRGRGGVSGRRSGGSGVNGVAKEIEDIGMRRENSFVDGKEKSSVYLGGGENMAQSDKGRLNGVRNGEDDDDMDSAYWDIATQYSSYGLGKDGLERSSYNSGEVQINNMVDDGSNAKKGTEGEMAERFKETSPTIFPSAHFMPEGKVNLDVGDRNIGNLEQKTENITSKSGAGGGSYDMRRRKVSAGNVVSSFLAPGSRRTSGEERRVSTDWSERSSSANEEVWSVAVDTIGAREDVVGRTGSRVLSPSEETGPVEQDARRGEHAVDKTEGDVWDSADELDLSKEEEGTVLSSESDDVEIKSKDGQYNDKDSVVPPKKKKSAGGESRKPSDASEVVGMLTRRTLGEFEEALDSRLFEKYIKEGQMDEVKYTLRDQKKLVTQLIKEREAITSAAEKKSSVVSSGENCLTLDAVLYRAKEDNLYTQLPSMLVEMMFHDRQLVPRWKIDGVEERSEETFMPGAVPARVGPKGESKLLKLVPKDEGTEEAVTVEKRNENVEVQENGNEMGADGGDEVEDPAIMHIVVAKPSVTKDSVESLWKEQKWPPTVKAKPSSALPLPPNASTKKKVKQNDANSRVKKDAPLSNQGSSLSWLSGTSQWANPGLLSSVLHKETDALPLLVDEETSGRSITDALKKSLPKEVPVGRSGVQRQLLPPLSSSSSSQHASVAFGKEVVNTSAPSVFCPTVGSKPSKTKERTSSSSSTAKIPHHGDAFYVAPYTRIVETGEVADEVADKFERELGGKERSSIPDLGPNRQKKLDPRGRGGASLDFKSVKDSEASGSKNVTRENGHLTHREDHMMLNTLENGFQVDPNMFPSAIDDDTPLEYGSASAAASESVLSTSTEVKGKVGSSRSRGGAEGNSDLDFLVECFPHRSRKYLQHLLTVNDGNMELTTVSALAADQDGLGHTPSEFVHDVSKPILQATLNGKGSSNSFGLGTVVVNGHGTRKKMQQELFNGVGERRSNGDNNMRQLIAWTEATEEEGHYLESDKARLEILDWNVPPEDVEVEEKEQWELQNGTGFLLEDNLMLRLSESLSIQLQGLFGSVDQTLFHQGGADSDLEILLSEKAAAEIYHKWIDTLEARKVEYQVRSQLLQGKANGTSRAAVAGSVSASSAPGKNRLWGGASGGASVGEARRYNGETLLHSPGSTKSGGVAQGTRAATREGSQSRPHPQIGMTSRPLQKLELEIGESGADYDHMREVAERHANLRSEYFQKAAEARSNRRYDIASFYAQQGHHHTQKMKDANKEAASFTLDKNNDERPDNHIDLHGLHVNEAVAALSKKMNEVEQGTELMVITGYGSGRQHRDARIKPVIKKYLDQNNVRYEEKNPGLLRVILR